MLRFSVLPRAIVALNAIRSTDATRPVLNGVHLAPDGTMTATDGHCLLTWRNAAEFDDTDGATAGALGYVLEITTALLKLAKGKKCSALALEISGDVAKWTATTANGFRDDNTATLARVMDGPYPRYRQVIPRDVPEVVGALPSLNAEYLGRFALVDPTESNGLTLTPTGPMRPVLVTFQNNPDAFGLIMPLVDKDAPRAVPAWVHPVTSDAAIQKFAADAIAKAEEQRTAAPAPDCPAAEHDDTNAECTCSHGMRITAAA